VRLARASKDARAPPREAISPSPGLTLPHLRSFWVAFSRNLNATGTDVYPLTPGSTHNLIAAWASGGIKDPVACDSGYPKHKGDWKGKVSF